MKKLIAILSILLISISFAQEGENKPAFSTLQFGVLTGVNFGAFSDRGGSILAEFNTNIISGLTLNLSAGYSKTFQPESIPIKTNQSGVIDGISYYNAESFTITQNEYDIFPVSLGARYIFKNSSLSPYLMISADYNFLSAKYDRTPGDTYSYTSYNDMPKEYKQVYFSNLPDHSYGVSLGAGILYPLSSKINLDVRYLYKIDSKILDTNKLLVGISF